MVGLFQQLLFLWILFAVSLPVYASVHYVDSKTGNDRRSGTSPDNAWETLERAGSVQYNAGDRLLLRRGCVFKGKLALSAAGNEQNPVVVDSYAGDDDSVEMPLIDAKGFLAGIQVEDCKYIEISHLEITADGGKAEEPAAAKQRFGVLVAADRRGDCSHIYLRNLYIHDIFASEPVESEGKNDTSNMGRGIDFSSRGDKAFLSPTSAG